jgi:hypothetical protein
VLDIAVQIIATFGPIALAVMGVWVSLSPPLNAGRSRWIWSGAFAFIGIITACALFIELRGTDTALDQIWAKVSSDENSALIDVGGLDPVKSPAGLGTYFNLQYASTGKITALRVTLSVSGVLSVNTLPHDSVMQYINLLRLDDILWEKNPSSISDMSVGSRKITTVLKADSDLSHKESNVLYVDDGQFNAISIGKMGLYIFTIVRYEDKNNLDKSYTQLENCEYYTLSYMYSHSCYHNQTIVKDKRF